MAPEGSILVTGTNGALGSNIVAQIVGNTAYAQKYHGLYTVRNVDGASALQSVLSKAPKTHEHDVVALDLDQLQSVRDVAADIKAQVASGKLPPIRALIWNAGFQEPSTQTFTKDGYDMSFQANYLSHWLLTLLLLGSMDKQHGRIVVVGSWTHDPEDERNKVGGPDYYSEERWKTIFTDAKSLADGTYSPPDSDPNGQAGMRRYGAGKLCEVMMIREMQERFDKDPELSNLSILGVDPGGMITDLLRRSNLWFTNPIVKKAVTPLVYAWSYFQPNSLMRPPAKSARDVLRAALETAPPPLSEHPKGLYFNGDEPKLQGAEARDPVKTSALWRASIDMTGLVPSDTALKVLD